MSISNESGKTSPTTPTSPNAPPLSTTVPTKLCHIVKRPDFDGYGFNLHSEKIKPGQYIGKVDANSPASAAGLKEGDRIIEVNGVPIGSETHKQVVQRIKAISLEVRLLLIDADAPTAINGSLNKNSSSSTSSTATTTITNTKNNNNNEKYQGSVQEIPGASANISTISMVSTKRMSNASSNGSQSSTTTAVPVPVTPPTVPIGADVTDRGLKNGGGNTANIENIANASVAQSRQQQKTREQESKNQINNNNVITPLPPSAKVASAAAATTTTTATTTAAATASSTSANNNVNKAGSLQLPMTAAEMRAKLMSKKKYDPKNESVDLKKKFEIIQKL